ncbi:MAG: hypothetical protein JWP87_2615 [Labilithrix sp.]|nr:hypothetical protein [Labilithrix sp.]
MPYRVRLAPLILTLASGLVYALACSDGGGSGSTGNDDGDGGPIALPDAAVGPNDADSPGTTMRLAHVSSDLGAVDFCYRMAKTSSFIGPVLGGGGGGTIQDPDAGAGEGGDASDGATSSDAPEAGTDGGAPSVSYRSVSRYLTLAASGPLTIALVAPGATSCATPIFTTDVTLDPGKLATVAIVGRSTADAGDNALALVAFIDDRTTTPAKARVRMIHAASGTSVREPAGALAVRASSSQTVSVADRVEPKKAGSPSDAVPVDSLGYATIAPVPSPATLGVGAASGSGAADASSESWLSEAGDLDLRGGSLHTGFVLTGEGAQPFEVLWCTDTSTSGDSTTCTRVR